MATISFYIDGSIVPLTKEQVNILSKKDINFFDRRAADNYSESLSIFSDIALAACLLLPTSLNISKNINRDMQKVNTMYLETILLATAITPIAKGISKRVRPFVYNPKVPLSKKLSSNARKSFFSGHATKAFASSVFYATIYNEYFQNSKYLPLVWGISLFSAGSVGYLRYKSGDHFPTDIITGAIVGSMIGYFIPKLHQAKKRQETSASNRSINLISFTLSF